MTKLYVRLIKMGSRTLTKQTSTNPRGIPEGMIVEVAKQLIIDKTKTYADVPEGYKTKVKAALKAAGYDENGDPLETATEAE